MYTLTIYNENQKSIFTIGGTTQSTLSPNIGEAALHFIKTIDLYIDLINGGQRLNNTFKLSADEKVSNFSISPNLAFQTAFVMFISQLHGHPYFSPEKMNEDTNPNKAVFKRVAELLHTTKIDSRAARLKVIDVIQQFVVPGIGKIVIQSDAPANEQALDAADFPEALIPEEFNCSLTSSIMDDPCYDPINQETIYDRNNIERHLAKTPQNPYTNTPLKPNSLKPATQLKASIQQFIRNVNFIADLFLHVDLEAHFKTYIDQIKTAKDIETLKQSLKEVMTPLLISKYKINTNNLFYEKSDLEKSFRRAASEANLADLSIFLKLYHVDINCQDSVHQKTAAHWVAQRFEEAVKSQSKDSFSKLQDCFDFFIDNNANIDLKAKNGKTAREIYLATGPALKALYAEADHTPQQKHK